MEIEKPVVGFYRFFGTPKEYLWRFLWRICNQKTLSLQATPNKSYTAYTYDYDTDTPFLPDTAV